MFIAIAYRKRDGIFVRMERQLVRLSWDLDIVNIGILLWHEGPIITSKVLTIDNGDDLRSGFKGGLVLLRQSWTGEAKRLRTRETGFDGLRLLSLKSIRKRCAPEAVKPISKILPGSQDSLKS
jgi:hypothetical protein